jgi:hypothetical protein
VAGYGQFCPISLGAEVFAERWTPLLLRELQRGLPRISRNLLTQAPTRTKTKARPRFST